VAITKPFTQNFSFFTTISFFFFMMEFWLSSVGEFRKIHHPRNVEV
jgi:hypothetical protein